MAKPGPFYEAFVTPRDNRTVFRELLLTRTPELVQRIKVIRPCSWAVCDLRIPPFAGDPSEVAGDDNARMLMIALGTPTDGVYRYDRTILVREAVEDDVGPTETFIRRFRPEYVAERRLFLAWLRQPTPVVSDDEIERAVGAAFPVEE